jgi:CheY-like chemotaxis protein
VTVVALVEDSADNRLLVEVILGDHYAVRSYADGETALAAFAADPPSLALLDVSLPGIDGPTVLARMRADPRLAGIPAIALTAHALDGDRRRLLEAGFDGYVAKPIVDETVLLRAIARCLDGRRG